MKTDVVRHILEKSSLCNVVVLQDFEPTLYFVETQFFSCSKNIQFPLCTPETFLVFAFVPMDSSLIFVQIMK